MSRASDDYDPNNVFSKIIAKEIPSYRVFETEHALAILDAFPSVQGHCLLIPKASGYATIMDMPAEIAADVYKELPRLARAVQKATGCEGVNILQNNGKAAGQEVFHVHIHVIPRFANDNQLLRYRAGSSMIEKEDAVDMLQRLQDAL